MKKIKTFLIESLSPIRKYLPALLLIAAVAGMIGFGALGSHDAAAAIKVDNGNNAKYTCGSGNNAVKVAINIGCNHQASNALVDAAFAIIRFLSVGVGMVVVASIVWAGVQYTAARDDPSAVAKARERIQNTLIALLVYIFAAAILNFVIPAGFLK